MSYIDSSVISPDSAPLGTGGSLFSKQVQNKPKSGRCLLGGTATLSPFTPRYALLLSWVHLGVLTLRDVSPPIFFTHYLKSSPSYQGNKNVPAYFSGATFRRLHFKAIAFVKIHPQVTFTVFSNCRN